MQLPRGYAVTCNIAAMYKNIYKGQAFKEETRWESRKLPLTTGGQLTKVVITMYHKLD